MLCLLYTSSTIAEAGEGNAERATTLLKELMVQYIVKRLQGLENAADELSQWQEIQTAAESIPQDAKAGELLTVLKQGFSLMKKTGAKQKAVIFTESVETQKMLQNLLSDRYLSLIHI